MVASIGGAAMSAPGWFNRGDGMHYWDGYRWDDQPPYVPPAVEKTTRIPNPFFLALAVLSGLVTMLPVLSFIGQPNVLAMLGVVWCGTWTAIWAYLAHRYR